MNTKYHNCADSIGDCWPRRDTNILMRLGRSCFVDCVAVPVVACICICTLIPLSSLLVCCVGSIPDIGNLLGGRVSGVEREGMLLLDMLLG